MTEFKNYVYYVALQPSSNKDELQVIGRYRSLVDTYGAIQADFNLTTNNFFDMNEEMEKEDSDNLCCFDGNGLPSDLYFKNCPVELAGNNRQTNGFGYVCDSKYMNVVILGAPEGEISRGKVMDALHIM